MNVQYISTALFLQTDEDKITGNIITEVKGKRS